LFFFRGGSGCCWEKKTRHRHGYAAPEIPGIMLLL
jgi:hypothetical protein